VNLLLVTADQWRADCVSWAPRPLVRTPVLERLASDGVAFLCHFGQATPCAPARASLYTGMYLFNHRVVSNGTPLDARHRTLAEWLARAGFEPFLFGFTDVAIDPRIVPADDPRLRTYEGVAAGFHPECLLLENLDAWLDHLEERGYGRLSREEVYDVPLGAAAPFRAEDSETAFLTDRFLAWLERAPRQPWFAHLSYIKPHPPWVLAAPWNRAVAPGQMPEPLRAPAVEAEAAVHPWLAACLQRRRDNWIGRVSGKAAGSLSRSDEQRLRALYAGAVREIDHHLGRVFEALARRDLLDRTLVVVTSDHGELLGDHWLWNKDSFHPEAFRVPLVIRDPRARARGRRVTAFTEHVDLFPTICERLGLEAPLQCDGYSLAPFLDGEQPANWREAAVYEFDFRDHARRYYEEWFGLEPDACQLMVRYGPRHALVHFLALEPLLVDLRRDPGWQCNQARSGRAGRTLLEATARLLSFRMFRNERRLTGVVLTPDGPKGRFDRA